MNASNIARFRLRMRTPYVRLKNLLVGQCYLRVLTLESERNLMNLFKSHFSSRGSIVSQLDGVAVAEGPVLYEIPLLITILLFAFFAIAAVVGRDPVSGIGAAILGFASLVLYSVRPVVALSKAGTRYVLMADEGEGYQAASTFVKIHRLEVRREESVADMGAPLLRTLADYTKKVSEAAEATPTRVVPLQPAETQIVDVEALEKEVRTLVEEAEKYRQFLRKLDEAREGGRISEKAYEELKKEYSEKLIEIENRIKELEKRIASRG